MQNGSGEKGFLNVIKVFLPCTSYPPLKKIEVFQIYFKRNLNSL